MGSSGLALSDEVEPPTHLRINCLPTYKYTHSSVYDD